MPEVTLKPSMLPETHPARNKRGWTKKARALLKQRSMRSRGYNRVRVLDKKLVRNTELFYRIADELEVFPESYNQRNWGTTEGKRAMASPCGTAFCIAGHAAHKTGWNPANEHSAKLTWDNVVRPGLPNKKLDIITVGRGELGLAADESAVLFAMNWKPAKGMTPSDALRAIGDGAQIQDVSFRLMNWDQRTLAHHYAKRGTIRTTGKKPVYS